MSKRYLFLLTLLSTATILLFLVGCGAQTDVQNQAPKKPVPPPKPKANYNEMVFIPAGECIIGGPATDPVTKFSSPPHKVNLKAFWIDKYEVTFEQFLTFSVDDKNTYHVQGNWRDFYSAEKALQPITGITLDDAIAYAKWAGKRLPTQEEWEKAASWDDNAKKQLRFPWGDEYKDGVANTSDAGNRQPVDIGKFEKDVSFYGVHDMLGNVFEWTGSYYDKYPGCKNNDPNFPKKLYTVKGASYGIPGNVWYLSARSSSPSNVLMGQGFRCAKDATPDDVAKFKK